MKLNFLSQHLNSIAFSRQQKNEETTVKDEESFSPFFRQTLAALGPLLLTALVGMTMGYSAVLLPQLQEPTNGTNIAIRITREEASWVASLAVLPMMAGTLIGGLFIEKYGRKRTHIIICLPYFIGWLLMYFATSLEILLTGRFLTGLSSGIIGPATGVYIGETSEPKYRGVLLGGIPLSVSAGLLVSHLLGTFFTWQTTALITSILPIVSWIMMTFTPESPTWLAQRGLPEQAEKALFWFRGTSEDTKQELDVMIAKQKESKKNVGDKDTKERLRELLAPEFWKPMSILVVFFVTSQWAGSNAVNFYSVTLMKKTLGDKINEYLATIVIDCIRLFASSVACVLLRNIGRKTLGLIGGLGTFIPLFILSGFIYFNKMYSWTNPVLLVFVPVSSLVAYIFFVTVGFVTLPWNLLGELLPLAKRSTGSAIASCVAYISIFSVVKTMPEMFEQLGVEGTFLVYGSMALLGTLFVFICLPETKGKTLHEIEEYFKKGDKEIADNKTSPF